MKRIFLFLVFFASIISCQKQEIDTVSVSFNTNILSGSSMVKSSSNECLDIIRDLTQYGTITLENRKTGDIYIALSVNETIVIPEGYYDVRYVDNPTNISGILYSTPVMTFHTYSVYISKETNVIDINLYYDCYATFVPKDECEYAIHLGNKAYEFPVVGNYHVAFFVDGYNAIQLYKTKNSNERTMFTLTTDGEEGTIKVEKGKYYILHSEYEDVESGFNINIQDMEEGVI